MPAVGSLILPDFPLFLSPMDDITDLSFRQVCKQHGADVLVTEFISSDALVRDAVKSRRKMCFTEEQRPIGIQIFGADEDSMLRCVDIVEEAKPDFIDINWGCPVRKVAGRGAGSGILKDIPAMLHITSVLVKRAKLPLTVKTRLGYDESDKPIVTLAEQLQDIGVAAISIHARTKTQMYSGTADWALLAKVKENSRLHIPVFGNGDLKTPQQVAKARDRYGVDGVLMGRAAIGNPWIFGQAKAYMREGAYHEPTVAERAAVCIEHLRAAAADKGERAAVIEMRKHYAGYFRSIPHFKPYRTRLVELTTVADIEALLHEVAQHFG